MVFYVFASFFSHFMSHSGCAEFSKMIKFIVLAELKCWFSFLTSKFTLLFTFKSCITCKLIFVLAVTVDNCVNIVHFDQIYDRFECKALSNGTMINTEQDCIFTVSVAIAKQKKNCASSKAMRFSTKDIVIGCCQYDEQQDNCNSLLKSAIRSFSRYTFIQFNQNFFIALDDFARCRIMRE